MQLKMRRGNDAVNGKINLASDKDIASGKGGKRGSEAGQTAATGVEHDELP
jgi:hypothetical protein